MKTIYLLIYSYYTVFLHVLLQAQSRGWTHHSFFALNSFTFVGFILGKFYSDLKALLWPSFRTLLIIQINSQYELDSHVINILKSLRGTSTCTSLLNFDMYDTSACMSSLPRPPVMTNIHFYLFELHGNLCLFGLLGFSSIWTSAVLNGRNLSLIATPLCCSRERFFPKGLCRSCKALG